MKKKGMVKMKKKGFTLIELLAVIVILAIIALIATPAVLNIIEDSRKGAAEASARNIVNTAKTYYMQETMNGRTLESIDLSTDTLKYDGTKPSKGIVFFDEGKPSSTMYINGYCVVVDKNNNVTSSKVAEDECNFNIQEKELVEFFVEDGDYIAGNGYIFAYNGVDTTITIPNQLSGTPYYYDLDGTKCEDFYNQMFEENGIDDLKGMGNLYCNMMLFQEFDAMKEMGFVVKKEGYVKITNYTFDYNKYVETFAFEPNTNVSDDEYNEALEYAKKTFSEDGVKLERFSLNALYNAGIIKGNREIINDNQNLTTNISIIGAYAFAEKNITSVDFSGNNNITMIGNMAFRVNQIQTLDLSNLTKLKYLNGFYSNEISNLKLPTSLEVIGDRAFTINNLGETLDLSHLTNLKSIDGFATNNIKTLKLPSNLKIIEDSAFLNNDIDNLEIPNSVIEIKSRAFNQNKLTGDNSFIYARTDLNGDGIGEIDYTKVVSYAGKQGDIIIIPSSVKVIGTLSFYEVYTNTITIPEGVEKIEKSAFFGNQLTDLQLPTTLKEIGKSAFEYSLNSNLINISIPNSVTSIGDSAFARNNSLNTITIDNVQGSISGSPWGASNATITWLR